MGVEENGDIGFLGVFFPKNIQYSTLNVQCSMKETALKWRNIIAMALWPSFFANVFDHRYSIIPFC